MQLWDGSCCKVTVVFYTLYAVHSFPQLLLPWLSDHPWPKPSLNLGPTVPQLPSHKFHLITPDFCWEDKGQLPATLFWIHHTLLLASSLFFGGVGWGWCGVSGVGGGVKQTFKILPVYCHPLCPEDRAGHSSAYGSHFLAARSCPSWSCHPCCGRKLLSHHSKPLHCFPQN